MTYGTSILLLQPDQRDSVHLISLTSYTFSNSLTALVSYQFNFFCYSIQQRFDVFGENLTSALRLHRNHSNLIKWYSNQYLILTKAMKTINTTFSIQVKCMPIRASFMSFLEFQMVPTLLIAFIMNVISVFSLVRLFFQTEITIATFYLGFNNAIWNFTATSPIFIAIYLSERINNTVGFLIHCHDGLVGVVGEVH